MAMLIRNGLLMTMTERGCFQGDVLIEKGLISHIAPTIGDMEDTELCILDAQGLVITPGLIDLNIRDNGYNADYIAETAIAAGVTTHLLRQDHADENCILADADGSIESHVRCIRPDAFTDEQLCSIFKYKDQHVICTIWSREQCGRVLRITEEADSKPVLAELVGCQDMAPEIARSGCPVIIGVHRSGGSSPWSLAARLDALGVPVTVSSSYPAANMKLLPVCAGLCMRDGMPRERALHTITSTPADIVGLTGRGRIAPGLRADLAIFDGDPLLLATSHVMTIAGGRIMRRS